MTAMYRRNTLELRLEGIAGGTWSTVSRDRLVTATLIWPRPLIAERVSIRPYRFDRDGLDLSARDWTERVLFKENVEGPFGLVLRVTEPLTDPQIHRTTAALGAALLRTAGTELARVASGPWLTTLARFPFAHLAGELAGAGKTPAIVAAGQTTLLPGTSGPIEVDLSAPEDIVRVRRRKAGGRTRTEREVVQRRGDPAGTVRLEAVYYRT